MTSLDKFDFDERYGSGRRLLTVTEVARLAGTSSEQILELVQLRRIPFCRPGNELRFDSAAVALWFDSGPSGGFRPSCGRSDVYLSPDSFRDA